MWPLSSWKHLPSLLHLSELSTSYKSQMEISLLIKTFSDHPLLETVIVFGCSTHLILICIVYYK